MVGELLTKCGIQTLPTDSYERLVNELHHTYQTRRFLVILDDVREATLDKLGDLLPPNPCASLVTSRIQQMGGVKTFPLDTMSWEQAEDLFKAILGDEIVANELETVKILADRCRFNPLAMEIAARRIRQFEGTRKPVARYFEIAQAKFSELKMEGDTRWDMVRIFDISYLDLSTDDREKFQTLSVFHPTGFPLEAVTVVWKTDSDTSRQVLRRFINLSLVKVVGTDEERLERYRLHDLLDEYAAPKLKASGKYNETKALLAGWLLELFDSNYGLRVESLSLILPERDNLIHACEWARGEKQADMLALLTTKPRNWFYNVFRETWIYWFAWLEASLQLGISENGLKANVLQAIGDIQQFRKENDAALESYNQALTLFRQVGAKLGEANVRAALCRLSLNSGSLVDAETQLDQVIAMRRLIGDIYSEGADYGNFSVVLLKMGEKTRAKEYALKARQAFEKVGESSILEQVDQLIAACDEKGE